MNLELVLLLVWVLAQLAIGLVVARRVRSEEDFFIAGRRLGPWMAGASVFATWFGAESIIGAAGQIHEDGLSPLSVEPFAYGLCLILMGLLFSAPLWRRGITTLADFFRQRYDGRVEKLAALVLLPTSILWAGAQVRAFGQVLAATSPAISLATGVAIAALLAGCYTMVGGLLADVATDILQGAVLVIGLVVLVCSVGADLGGPLNLLTAACERLAEPSAESVSLLDLLEAWAIPICGSVVAQEALSRTLAARTATLARRAGVMGGGLYLLIGLLPVTLGLVGGRLVGGLEDKEQLMPRLAAEHLPLFLHVLFSGALIAAILSTVDSTLLVVASLVERNLILSPESNERRRLFVARLSVLGAALAAWWLAISAEGVFALVEEASAFGSAGVFVCVTLGLSSPRGGPRSALAALAAGALGWVVFSRTDLPWPYLCSLALAFLGYFACAKRRAPGNGT